MWNKFYKIDSGVIILDRQQTIVNTNNFWFSPTYGQKILFENCNQTKKGLSPKGADVGL